MAPSSILLASWIKVPEILFSYLPICHCSVHFTYIFSTSHTFADLMCQNTASTMYIQWSYCLIGLCFYLACRISLQIVFTEVQCSCSGTLHLVPKSTVLTSHEIYGIPARRVLSNLQKQPLHKYTSTELQLLQVYYP